MLLWARQSYYQAIAIQCNTGDVDAILIQFLIDEEAVGRRQAAMGRTDLERYLFMA
ncbi:Uncharacterised protein [Edwardsiella tarda]|nr:Uncharacterised protein [Edwardsiella tarda]